VKRKEDEVIELIEDSDDSDSSILEFITPTKATRPRRRSSVYNSSTATATSTDLLDDSVSEYEFE